jgi:hypothetical protein
MNELEHIPAGLDADLDTLKGKRHELLGRLGALWTALEQVEAELPAAKEKDRQAIVAAVSANKKRPAATNTAAAEKAIETVKADMAAIGMALDENERLVIEHIEDVRTDLQHRISELREANRAPGQDALEQLSRSLLREGELQSFERWLDNPLTPASGKLQPYQPRGLRLDARRVRRLGEQGGTGTSVSELVDLIGECFEGVRYRDTELLAMARAAGLQVISVERDDSGSAALASPFERKAQRTIPNIATAGLVKFTFNKARFQTGQLKAIRLLVAVETLNAMSVVDCFKLNQQHLESAYRDDKRLIASVDETTTELIKSLRTNTSTTATERQEIIATRQELRETEQRRVRDLDELRAEREGESVAT